MNLGNYLNKDYTIRSINNPFETWVIDDFLTQDSLDLIHQSWPSNNSPAWIATRETINGKKNILEQGMLAISNSDDIPPHMQDIFMFFHSDKFVRHISEVINVKSLIEEKTMNWSGLRVMLPNSKQLIHSDARINPVSGLRKEITCLLYLNKDYRKSDDGGCLELWDDSMKNCVHEIEPIDNRLVLFKNSNKSYHGVPSVKSERKAITWSIASKLSPNSTRKKALFVKRPNDSQSIKELGLERSLVK
jgi:hypothetical protein